jgi:Flp pilus assembly protein TadB
MYHEELRGYTIQQINKCEFMIVKFYMKSNSSNGRDRKRIGLVALILIIIILFIVVVLVHILLVVLDVFDVFILFVLFFAVRGLNWF